MGTVCLNTRFSKAAGRNPFLLIAPELAKLAPQLMGWKRVLDLVKNFRAVVLEHVDRHRAENDEDESPRDFIDAYLKEIKSTTDPSSSFYKDAGSKCFSKLLNLTSICTPM